MALMPFLYISCIDFKGADNGIFINDRYALTLAYGYDWLSYYRHYIVVTMRKEYTVTVNIFGVYIKKVGAFMRLIEKVESIIIDELPALKEVYIHIHQNPELSMQEYETSSYIANQLKELDIDVTEGVGGTGVVAIIRNGEGPTIMVRADMDALPMKESNGLSYASVKTMIDRKGHETPVSHMCGHDMHATMLLGAVTVLAKKKDAWSGTIVAIFQPGEETAEGSQAMIDDNLLAHIPKPEIILGQHLMSFKSGTVGYRPGQILTAGDSLKVTFFGAGGHGGMPNNAIDPIVMAASAVVRLQTIVSREVAPQTQAVLTIGEFHAGKAENIIPDEAYIKLNIRTIDESVRAHMLEAIKRICNAEAQASKAPKMPMFEEINNYPLTVNDVAATKKIEKEFALTFGDNAFEMSPLGASEDFSRYGRAWHIPYVYWFIGSTAPELYNQAVANDDIGSLPGPHSPFWVVDLETTLVTGMKAMLSAVGAWFDKK